MEGPRRMLALMLSVRLCDRRSVSKTSGATCPGGGPHGLCAWLCAPLVVTANVCRAQVMWVVRREVWRSVPGLAGDHAWAGERRYCWCRPLASRSVLHTSPPRSSSSLLRGAGATCHAEVEGVGWGVEGGNAMHGTMPLHRWTDAMHVQSVCHMPAGKQAHVRAGVANMLRATARRHRSSLKGRLSC